MSLKQETLTKDDEFFNGAPTDATVTGLGQMVYWKGCTIKVYKTGKEGEYVDIIRICDGQALVRKGTSLLFEGGKVKEE